jgi:hypothetical protein
MMGQDLCHGAAYVCLTIHHYFQNDYQNSIGVVTNDGYVYGQAAGTAHNEGSDVFGQPRLPSGAADATWGANDVARRRYINPRM